MTIPNCRKSDKYNVNNLDKIDKAFIEGFDQALEEIISLFEDNLNCMAWNRDAIYNVEKILQLESESIAENIAIWHESARNEWITAFINKQEKENSK